jgi:mRNA-degrading endonuclease RelE of RelBE toxin-antitoxin system
MTVKHDIFFSEDARTHLRQMSARERQVVCTGIARALLDEPTKETRNLKGLRPNPLAKFELRIGTLRVFFEVNAEEREVTILAVGRKEGNRLFVGGKEVKL